MTKKKNMTAGQRQLVLEQKIEQMEMATKMSQMLLQQLGQSTNQIGKDLSELAVRQRDLQYRSLAVQELSNISVEQIDARAEELQVNDFTEASDKEDAEKNYTPATVVADDSVIIITTKVDGEQSQGILRSKLILEELAFPDFKADLLGKEVGAELIADINGVEHQVKLLGIRTAPPAPEPEEVPELSEIPTSEETTPVEANG